MNRRLRIPGIFPGGSPFPTPIDPPVIATTELVPVGPGEQYTTMLEALTGDLVSTNFILVGTVDDSGNTFSGDARTITIFMPPNSTWDIEDCVFQTLVKFTVRNTIPGINPIKNPKVTSDKNGFTISAPCTLSFYDVWTDIPMTLNGGTVEVHGCDFNGSGLGGITIVNGTLKLYDLTLRNYGSIAITGAGILEAYNCFLYTQITVALGTANLVLYNTTVSPTGFEAMNFASSGVNITASFCEFFGFTNEPAVKLNGSVSPNGELPCFLNCFFMTNHATNPAISSTNPAAIQQYYNCVSKNGFDPNITFDPGNASNHAG